MAKILGERGLEPRTCVCFKLCIPLGYRSNVDLNIRVFVYNIVMRIYLYQTGTHGARDFGRIFPCVRLRTEGAGAAA